MYKNLLLVFAISSAIFLVSCGKQEDAKKASMSLEDVGGCFATTVWKFKQGMTITPAQQKLLQDNQAQYESIYKSVGENCVDPSGMMMGECIEKRLSSSDFAFFKGYNSAMNFLTGPQDPSKLPNYEVAGVAYCSSLN